MFKLFKKYPQQSVLVFLIIYGVLNAFLHQPLELNQYKFFIVAYFFPYFPLSYGVYTYNIYVWTVIAAICLAWAKKYPLTLFLSIYTLWEFPTFLNNALVQHIAYAPFLVILSITSIFLIQASNSILIRPLVEYIKRHDEYLESISKCNS